MNVTVYREQEKWKEVSDIVLMKKTEDILLFHVNTVNKYPQIIFGGHNSFVFESRTKVIFESPWKGSSLICEVERYNVIVALFNTKLYDLESENVLYKDDGQSDHHLYNNLSL